MPTRRVLIIEDDTALAEVLTYNLEEAGYAVTRAANGQEGLHQAQVISPHLIILDLMLPLIDGIEVCRRLRSDPATREVYEEQLGRFVEKLSTVLDAR